MLGAAADTPAVEEDPHHGGRHLQVGRHHTCSSPSPTDSHPVSVEMLHQSDVKKQKKNFPLFVTRDELPVSVMEALQLLPSLPSNDNVRFFWVFFLYVCGCAFDHRGKKRGGKVLCAPF